MAAGDFINTEPVVDGDRRMGYIWSFSAGIKHELMANTAVSVDYVGNRGRDQTGLIDINEPRLLPNGTIGRPGIAVFDPTGELIPAQARGAAFQRVLQFQTLDALNTDYNALELALEKRQSNRWSGRIAYTLSAANDVQGGAAGGNAISTKRVGDDLDPRSDYGRAAFDNRHALATSVFVNPWGGLGIGGVYRYYSGNPINELVGTDVNRDRDNFDRPMRGIDDLTMPIRSALDASGRGSATGSTARMSCCWTSGRSTSSLWAVSATWGCSGKSTTRPTGSTTATRRATGAAATSWCRRRRTALARCSSASGTPSNPPELRESRRTLGQRPPRFSSSFPGVLSQHAARFRLLDVSLHVGWKQESALLQCLGGLLHGRHVAVVGLVTFLQRQTWIARSATLRCRGPERYVLAVRLAALVDAEVRTAQRPACGGGDRCFDWRQADTSDLVAVLIDL